MQLTLNGYVLPIRQLSRDFLILRDPIDHPPAEAEITVWVDGFERHWPVRLPNGIAASGDPTTIASCGG